MPNVSQSNAKKGKWHQKQIRLMSRNSACWLCLAHFFVPAWRWLCCLWSENVQKDNSKRNIFKSWILLISRASVQTCTIRTLQHRGGNLWIYYFPKTFREKSSTVNWRASSHPWWHAFFEFPILLDWHLLFCVMKDLHVILSFNWKMPCSQTSSNIDGTVHNNLFIEIDSKFYLVKNDIFSLSPSS